MHCFSASSVSCVTERLSGCKDTDLYWIIANYYLKKYYFTVASDSIVKVPLQTIHEPQRLFGTTIVTNKMNGFDNKPVLMK